MDKVYYIVKCPRCNLIFITLAKNRVKCRNCGRTFKVINHLIAVTQDKEKAKIIYYKSIKPPLWIRHIN